ncbi:S9 family peptidase [Mucilaginibacter boryungensis]|uniref:S9 family peptidase n=1 Tax=Mucilaginibacter boryungensis TaxID=768480 RepID=A0ABR9XKE7_9SPHI|nr:prolyl oligopeptidase family serine peptidase [Mucilaginibacter boryungensis]MBE9667480.1 S9 family peptidase [Mucilaginibacter boryungensis]
MYHRIKYKPFAVIILLVFALQACKQQQVREIPVRDFFKTPEKSSFKISPDGKYISYLKPFKEKQNLFVQDLSNGKERRVTSFTDYAVRRDYAWTINDQLVFSQDLISFKQIKLYALNLATMQMRTLLSQDKASMQLILTKNKQQPDVITISMNKRDSATFDIYRLNIRTGELKTYVINPGNITDWFPDPDGKIRLAKSSDGVDESILYRANDFASFKPIIKNNFKNSVQPIAFTGDKNYFYAVSNVNRDKSALVKINAENSKDETVVFASDKADISDVGYAKYKHRIESVSWEGAKQQTHFLDKDIEHIYNDLSNQLKGSKIRITDRDSAEKKFIINTYTDRDPGSYYLCEPAIKKLTKIGETNPGISPDELCAMQPIAFKARDGMLINGYLTLPQNKDKTNLPVVVLPHDGPWNRDSWRYSSEVQFLANRGYAVFQVNYRGSTGYGKAFYSAGFKQVGGKIQDDITDGVKWLIAQKIANPKKIAIMGGGFGGFSALYGASFHPELYNCVIVQHALINFFTYMKDVPPFFKSRIQMMYEKVGNPETDANQFRAISPVFHPDKIKLPLLIIQGGRDPRANISEIKQFVSELQHRKVPVTFMFKENEKAFFSERNRMLMYTEIEKFLDNNMRVKP